MLEPVSGLGGLRVSYAAILETSSRNTSVSTEGAYVAEAASAAMEWRERSQALFGEKAALISEIVLTGRECGRPDWDGYGAYGVDVTAVRNAAAFVRALPDDVPLPEASPEPDGAISLDWVASRSRVFSVSTGQSDRLAFAWIDGTNRGHGVERFDGINVPRRILSGIDDTLNAHAAVRAT